MHEPSPVRYDTPRRRGTMTAPPATSLADTRRSSEPPPAKPACLVRSADFFAHPRKESPFIEVFCCKDSALPLAARELKGPNGIVFSTDEKRLYVRTWNLDVRTTARRPVQYDLSLGGFLFVDLTSQLPGEDALDAKKASTHGDLSLVAPCAPHRIDLLQLGIRP